MYTTYLVYSIYRRVHKTATAVHAAWSSYVIRCMQRHERGNETSSQCMHHKSTYSAASTLCNYIHSIACIGYSAAVYTPYCSACLPPCLCLTSNLYMHLLLCPTCMNLDTYPVILSNLLLFDSSKLLSFSAIASQLPFSSKICIGYRPRQRLLCIILHAIYIATLSQKLNMCCIEFINLGASKACIHRYKSQYSHT